MTTATRESDKGGRYIDQLNIARLNGAWGEVKELTRKVQKHAPTRTCLLVAAAAESDITPNIVSGSSSSQKQPDDNYSSVVQKLAQAIEQEKSHPEDAFAARVVMAHAHLAQGQWSEVLNFIATEHFSPEQGGSSDVLLLSVLKGIYVLASAHEKLGSTDQAAGLLESALPMIETRKQSILAHRETHRWASRILGQQCILQSAQYEKKSIESMSGALLRYRAWTSFTTGSVSNDSAMQPASRIWTAYHHLVADIFRSNLIYTDEAQQPLAVRGYHISKSTVDYQRARQFAELQAATKGCESALMKENDFPKASESNETFERFADEVVQIWRIIASSEWHDSQLGEGGKIKYTRSVLDLLYRAASRTFHSTPILRHLITLHATLAEFDLATKALDAYIEIISKGKARAEKTGKHELGLDNDDVVLYALSDAIRFLCLYGQSDQALKAYQLGQKISSWLHQKRPRSSSGVSTTFDPSAASEIVEAEQFSTHGALAAAYKAIGQSKATWARYVQDTKQRADLQDEAIRSLARALHLASQASPDLEIGYLLAYSQAERRSVAAAIETVTTALTHDRKSTVFSISRTPAETAFAAQKKRLPLLHLLVLLLSANGQFDTALTICESTLEETVNAARECETYHTELDDSNNVERPSGELPDFLTQHLDDEEKECLVQIKMTEMELLILIENTSYAASKRQDLLKTYTQLFGNPRPKSAVQTISGNTIATVAKSRPGTVKSFRESIFGRPKSVRKSLDGTTFDAPPVPEHPLLAKNTERAGPTAASPPILLKVTNEDGEQVEDEPKSRLGRISLSIRRGRDRHSHDVSKLTQEEDHATKRSASHPLPTTALNGTTPVITDASSQNRGRQPSQGSVVAKPLTSEEPVLTNGISEKDESQAVTLPELRIVQRTELSIKNPSPFLTPHQRKGHHISILVDIWLFISAMYTREDHYDEAKAASKEAQRLVEVFQKEQANVESSARAWRDRGWGLGKSICRLMADTCAERGRIEALLSAPHAALDMYERGLTYDTDHSITITHLAAILLDIYEEKIPAEPPSSKDLVHIATSNSTMNIDNIPIPTINTSQSESDVEQNAKQAPRLPKPLDPSPAELNRIAARDRAYMLLSSLTKFGDGWDNAEAWFNLSRAHELMGQTEQAESCLWWVVELEDARPLRPWHVAGFMA